MGYDKTTHIRVGLFGKLKKALSYVAFSIKFKLTEENKGKSREDAWKRKNGKFGTEGREFYVSSLVIIYPLRRKWDLIIGVKQE